MMQPTIMQDHSLRHVRQRSSRKQRRARLVRILGVLILAVLMLVLLPRVVETTARSEAPATESYVVRSGDTLWDIANRYNQGGDVRRLIAAIKDANHLRTPTIQPGQELVIPLIQGR